MPEQGVVQKSGAHLAHFFGLMPVALALPGVSRQRDEATLVGEALPRDRIPERVQLAQAAEHGRAFLFVAP